ncbi:ABC transporter substrate-binding protein [Variovorax sp. J31P179]|uniref:ABC transporter substrate-binding protein n=1 Tax=Variovorax sp. J31P179 TaxID=3053508 RepID=UPI00257612F3|nr:ABC transporter substrate-binding protein [Variovorax sp. J31P179]MDM0082237.1 ABC transporter substrate-binding protein [Variovorax sp. J31P179]
MSLRRRTLLHSGLAGLAPAFLGAPARAAGVSSGEIVLGTHLDLSGPAAITMPPIRNGLQMRVDEANEAGGIHGRKLRFVIEDNGSQPPQAVRVVDKLIRRDEVFALLCPFGSGPGVATVKKTVDAGVICFAPYGAAALIRKASGDSPLLFTANLHYDTTTAAGLKWTLAKLGSKKVGFIYQEGPFGDLVGKGVREGLAAKGMALAAEAGYKVGDIDFSSQVARMRAAGVDLIVGATTTRETIAVAAEVKKLGWSGVNVLTASPGRAGTTLSIGKASVEGLYGIGGWRITPASAQGPALKRWSDSYRKRFNMEPDDVALVFYDYASWFMQGLQAAGKDLTTAGLVKTLQASSFKGESSYETQRFKDNHVDPEWCRVEQVVDGQWLPRSEIIDPAKSSL